jgi:hypothetical protein
MRDAKRMKSLLNIIPLLACISMLFALSMRKNLSKHDSFHEMRKKISCIPKEDQLVLSWFFRTLVQKFCAGHVLFGSKPMTFIGYRRPLRNNSDMLMPRDFLNKNDLMMHLAVSTWEKYQALFPMKNFAIIDYLEPNGLVTILLINKKTLLQKIEEEWDEFEILYSRNIHAEEVLEQIINKDPVFFEMFHKNEVLKGVLLGYGKNNAKIFARKMQIWNELKEIQYNGITHKIKRKAPNYKITKPTFGFNSLKEELHSLDERTKCIGKSGCNFNFTPRVGFVADNEDPSTKDLRRRYRLEKKQMPHTYSNGDFLTTTLAKLVE